MARLLSIAEYKPKTDAHSSLEVLQLDSIFDILERSLASPLNYRSETVFGEDLLGVGLRDGSLTKLSKTNQDYVTDALEKEALKAGYLGGVRVSDYSPSKTDNGSHAYLCCYKSLLQREKMDRRRSCYDGLAIGIGCTLVLLALSVGITMAILG